ncbi:MAG TPA: HDOD domain-containing protein [Phycisphaerales bacterium]|nr:HDOD domain-containing protein [Phycisphaerales bacterium]
MARLSDVLVIDKLPAMPVALARALPLLFEPRSEWSAIERVIRQDEALTGTVLRLANSAVFGAPGRYFDLRTALPRLGRDLLRKTLLQQHVSGITGGENAAFGLRRGDMWRSALGGAIAAEEFARRHAPEAVPLAFVCGLLRDIGKLAVNATYGDAYAAMISPHLARGGSFTDAERAALGFDHAQVGAALACQWNLPRRIADAIETHHRPVPPGPGHDSLFDVVHAADSICRWAGLGVGDEGMEYGLATHVRESLRLDRRAAEREITLVWERLREAETPLEQATKQGAAA